MLSNKKLSEAVERLEQRLGLKRGFFDSLIREDDWSFVIKSHALLEAALTHWIVSHLGETKISDFVARLDTSDPVRGKLAIFQSLALLNKRERKFLTALSELRNRLVHDVSNTDFTFDQYIQKLDKNQRKSFSDSFGYAYTRLMDNGEFAVGDPELVLRYPKAAIRDGLHFLLIATSINVDVNELTAQAEDIHSNHLARLLKQGG